VTVHALHRKAITIPMAYYEALEDICDGMSALREGGMIEYEQEYADRVTHAFKIIGMLQPEGDLYSGDREEKCDSEQTQSSNAVGALHKVRLAHTGSCAACSSVPVAGNDESG